MHAACCAFRLQFASICASCSRRYSASSSRLFLRQRPAREQVGPPLPRAPQRLLQGASARISAWCPDNSTSGTAHSLVHLRPRVVRAIEQPVGERILARRLARRSARPGSSRAIASISISAGNSPPDTTKSPIAISSSTSRAISRSSMPSYRPASEHVARVSPPPPARPPALRQRLAGRRQVDRRASPRTPSAACAALAAAIACASGSASITIPGPPPYGRSSTVRCAVRREIARIPHAAAATARARSARPVTPNRAACSTISGNSVTTSIRILRARPASSPPASRRRSGRLRRRPRR